jgi:cytochrome c
MKKIFRLAQMIRAKLPNRRFCANPVLSTHSMPVVAAFVPVVPCRRNDPHRDRRGMP